MVKLFLTFFSTLFLGTQIIPSQDLKINETEVLYEDQMYPAVQIVMNIPEDDVKSGFNDFVKERFNTNLKGFGLLTRKDEVYTDFEKLSGLAEGQIKLIGVYQKNNQSIELNLLAQWEDGSMVDPKANQETFTNLKMIAKEFISTFIPTYYHELVEESQDNLEKARKEVNDTREDIQKNKERIVDLKQEILELQNEVQEFERELLKLEDEAEKQSDRYDALEARKEKILEQLSRIQ